ncbi:MAG: hypothetical protein R3F20_12950 [Planctomycetota bacterium]
MLRSLLAGALVAAATTALPAQSVTFTGDAQADFAAGTELLDSAGSDVGVPGYLAGFTSGWDMRAMHVSYDLATDTLFVGLDSRGVMGDADGDGDPSATSLPLLLNGGTDAPDLSLTETASISFDFDGNGTYDVVAGISALDAIPTLRVATYNGPASAPGFSFDMDLPMHVGAIFASPSAAQPDLEFTVVGFSALVAGYNGASTVTMNLMANAGSLVDGGIGEDFVFGQFTITTDDGGPLEGCTPGYWKNHHPAWAPTGLAPTMLVSDVFASDVLDDLGISMWTLDQALQGGGGPKLFGAAKILMRAATAGALNALHPDINYPRAYADLVSDVLAALATEDRATIIALAAEIDDDNNLGCD